MTVSVERTLMHLKCSESILNKITSSKDITTQIVMNISNLCRYKFQDLRRSRLWLRNLATVSDRMKTWQIESYGGVEDIVLTSVRKPVIEKPSEILIKVNAASVNPIDTAVLEGYGRNVFKVLRSLSQLTVGKFESDPPAFPLTVGRDFSGEVIRVGQCISKVKPGDKVWGVVSPQRQGSHAEFVITEAFNISPKPECLTDIEAASIPYVALTSWSTAVITGGLTPQDSYGSKILVIGASGGVGTFITQMLATWGAEVIGVCSEDSFELVLSCGVSEVYDYRDPKTMSILTQNPQFDVIIDAGGTNNLRWTEGLKEMKNASYISLFSPLLNDTDQNGLILGLLKTASKLFEQNSVALPKGRSCRWSYFMPNKMALKEIGKYVDQNKIRPVIDKVFRFDDVESAYRHVRDGPNRGKTVIDFSS